MFGLQKYGNGIGLHRALSFYKYIGIPYDYFSTRSIVVTGSNGKGSTTRFIYELLQTKYAKVGCFISPHLIELTERFEVSGIQIESQQLNDYKDRVLDFNTHYLASDDAIGAFELLFYIAVQWFLDQKVDCVVWEAGIGGRYDPTRMVFASISALTSLDLEHTELLGSSKELIAYDKLDVTCVGGETVVSACVEHTLTERLSAYAAVSGKKLHFLSELVTNTNYGITDAHQHFETRWLDAGIDRPILNLSIPLLGAHQIENAVTAIEITQRFLSRRTATLLSATEISAALARVRWAGRMERISEKPDIWIDVGHTPDALRRVIGTILELYRREKLLVVYGISYNKDAQNITHLIESNFDEIVLTKAYKNGTDVNTLKEAFSEQHRITAMFNQIEDAVSFALQQGSEREKTVIVLGGLFLAVEFKVAFQGGNPRALQFF